MEEKQACQSMKSNWKLIGPHTYRHLIFLIKKPEIHTRIKTASSTNGTGQTGWLHVEESK